MRRVVKRGVPAAPSTPPARLPKKRALTETPKKRAADLPQRRALTTAPKKRAAGGADPHKGSFPPQVHASVKPHTLILGTQPSDNSLEHSGYFLTNANAFWHICGDALGFRRGFHIRGRTEAVESIRPHLLHEEVVATYDEALQRLLSHGYAIWDMVESSTRKGSLDSAIKNAKLADVRGLLAVHPTIRRVCFATGSGSADIFRKGHREWLREPGAFSVGADDESQAVFAKHVAPPAVGGADAVGWQPVELVVMESVSPAFVPRQAHAASKQVAKGHDDEWSREPAAAYKWKRAVWFRRCFAQEEAVIRAGAIDLRA